MPTDETNLKPREIREKLLRAAFELIAERGIDAVSVREIVEKVNVSKPVLYYYFKDKEDLCTQLYEQINEHVKEVYNELQSEKTSIKKFIAVKFRHEMNDLHKSPKLAKLLIRTMANVSGERKDRFGLLMDDIYNSGKEMMFKILAEAEERGEIRKGSGRLLAFNIHACSLHIMTLVARGEIDNLKETFPEDLADQIFSGVQP